MPADLEALSLDALRRRRDSVHASEQAVSYRRRLLHAQLDIVRATTEDRDPAPFASRLADALRDRPSAGTGPTRAVAVDSAVAGTDEPPPLPSDLDALDEEALARLLARLRDEEEAVSEKRRALLAELDALQAEIVRRYRRDGVDLDVLLQEGTA